MSQIYLGAKNNNQINELYNIILNVLSNTGQTCYDLTSYISIMPKPDILKPNLMVIGKQ